MDLISKIKNFFKGGQQTHNTSEEGSGDLTKSKTFRLWGAVLGAALVLLLTFSAGVFVGLEKAQFSYKWGENYYRNFVGFMPPPMPGVRIKFNLPTDSDYMNAHGILGQVVKINGSTLTIKDDDGTEKNILVSDDTIFAKDRGNINISDLRINDNIVVIGSPDDQGQMQAKLIRIVKP